jgi:hypothetical protein
VRNVRPMSEAILGPGETSKEIAEHARHAAHRSERDRFISILEAGLLAVVALLAAWSGYSAAKWSTESRLTVSEAATTRNAANTEELVALDERLGDGLVFNAWLGAYATGNPEATEIALKRFRPELRVAFDAWIATDPDNNPAAPPGPQAMPEYKQPEKAHAKALKAKAERLAAEGSDQGTTGDDYVRITVYLASVLFIVGISTQFPVRAARYGLIGIGGAILLFSVVQLAGLAAPPS